MTSGAHRPYKRRTSQRILNQAEDLPRYVLHFFRIPTATSINLAEEERKNYNQMNPAIIYTWSAGPNGHLTVWWWTNDWWTFHTFQAAPSYQQGYNQGVASVTDVRAYMPVVDPSLQHSRFVRNGF